MKEIWKPIVGYEGFYLVSNLGRVRSLPRNGTSGKKLKLITDRDGYKIVCLMMLGKRANKKVHRLVAESFISNPTRKPCVNHIDNDRGNNFIVNLEWVSIAENNQYMVNQQRNRCNPNRCLVTGRFKTKEKAYA